MTEMARHSFAAGKYIYIGITRFRLLARFRNEGVEYWTLKNTKDGIEQTKARSELDCLYDDHILRFDGDRDEDNEEKRQERRRRHGVPLSDMALAQQTRILYRKAVLRAVEERTAPGCKTARIIKNGVRTENTVLQSLLDELGRELGLKYLGKEMTIDQSTYYRWCEKYRLYEDQRDLAGDYGKRGNHNQLHLRVKQIMKKVMDGEIEEAKLRNYPGQKARPVMKIMMTKVLKHVKAEREKTPDVTLRFPEKTTFYNYWNRYDAHLRDLAKYGPQKARQLYRYPTTIPRNPLHALALVQFDETLLPIFLIDELLGVPLGRPWLAWLVDVYSGAIIGIYLGFEPPSDLVIGSTLRHAASMKSYVATEYPGLPPWRYSGFPGFLIFDNSLAAHGNTILTITANFDIPYDFTPARMPWTKSEIEESFKVANTQWLQEMSGFVLDPTNGIDPKDYDPRQNAVMGIRHLLYVLHCWLLEVYHKKPTPGTRLSPDDRWTAGTAEVDPEFPESNADLDLMFGIVRTATRLDHRGVVYENILYYSNELHQIRRQYGHTQKVKVKVNPLNLGKIHVWDPGERMWIPATPYGDGYRDYANNLELHCHTLFQRHAEKICGYKSLEALIESKLHLQELVSTALPDALSIRANTLIARAMGIGSQHIFSNLDHAGSLPKLSGPFAGQRLNPLVPAHGPLPAVSDQTKEVASDRQMEATTLPIAIDTNPKRKKSAIPVFKTDHSIGRR
jgi:hypothetical protein